MLIGFLSASPSRGIPFNRMFTLRDYPDDILPLYAQGFSVAKFLIVQKGRKPFLEFLATGLELETPGREIRAWDQATRQHYGYKDLSELQIHWQRWVADGSDVSKLARQGGRGQTKEIAAKSAESTIRDQTSPVGAALRDNRRKVDAPLQPVRTANNSASLNEVNQGWYAKQMKMGATTRSFSPPKSSAKTIWR